jgi:hypothetical protein
MVRFSWRRPAEPKSMLIPLRRCVVGHVRSGTDAFAHYPSLHAGVVGEPCSDSSTCARELGFDALADETLAIRDGRAKKRRRTSAPSEPA